MVLPGVVGMGRWELLGLSAGIGCIRKSSSGDYHDSYLRVFDC